MARTITRIEAIGAFGDLLDSLPNDKETVIVGETGDPVAVVISPDEFNSYARARAWETVRGVQDRNADQNPDEVLAFVTSIVEDVRREQHEKRRSSSSSD
jgi:PHD/YefM family antitoxin component YafN of YafNO toxin-antitoxin module